MRHHWKNIARVVRMRKKKSLTFFPVIFLANYVLDDFVDSIFYSTIRVPTYRILRVCMLFRRQILRNVYLPTFQVVACNLRIYNDSKDGIYYSTAVIISHWVSFFSEFRSIVPEVEAVVICNPSISHRHFLHGRINIFKSSVVLIRARTMISHIKNKVSIFRGKNNSQ